MVPLRLILNHCYVLYLFPQGHLLVNMMLSSVCCVIGGVYCLALLGSQFSLKKVQNAPDDMDQDKGIVAIRNVHTLPAGKLILNRK